jgi:hypothetical protein
MSRESNRAAMPLAAEMVDEIRATCPDAKVLWISEGDKEIGRRPTLESNYFEISAETFDALREHAAISAKRTKR